MDAGKLDRKVELLTLRESPGALEWSPVSDLWAKVEYPGRKNLFSAVGLGARSVEFTIRRRPLTLYDALRLDGEHCFLTEITEQGRGYLTVKAALVELVQCAYENMRFPACLTEKYVQYEAMMPMDVNRVRYVLVTPKAMQLAPGHILDISGTAYHILLAHTLDGYKNEYEIMRTVDL